MITSSQLAKAIHRHQLAATKAEKQFLDGVDLEVITRELLMAVDNLQELLTNFRTQEEAK